MNVKKTFFVTLAIAFGITLAFIVASLTLIATGAVKRNYFGGISFAFEESQANQILADHTAQKKIIAGLKVSNTSLVDGEAPQLKALIMDIENPNDDLEQGYLSFDLLLIRDGKVIKVLKVVESLSIPHAKTKKVIADVVMAEPVEYDAFEVLPRD